MARINLLPWRVERRKQREREFYVMLGFSTLVGILVSALVWFYYDAQVSGQNDRNAFLVSEIEGVKAQNREIDQLDKKKEHLLARKKVIEELQSNRSQMVHLFDSLARTIPDGVVLTTIKQEGNSLTLQGRSQSNVRVSTYMRNIEGSGWMTNPDLSIIEAKEQDKNTLIDSRALPYVFTIKAKLSKPESPDEARHRLISPNSGKSSAASSADFKPLSEDNR
ncbi:MAG TPA: PilN domain-containing protein [Xylella fastidiosa subsp. multiplex]